MHAYDYAIRQVRNVVMYSEIHLHHTLQTPLYISAGERRHLLRNLVLPGSSMAHE